MKRELMMGLSLLLSASMMSGCAGPRKTGHENETVKSSESTSTKKDSNDQKDSTDQSDTQDQKKVTEKKATQKTNSSQKKNETKNTTDKKKTTKKATTSKTTQTNNSSTKAASQGKTICIDAGHQRYANTGLEAIGPGSSTKKMKVTGGTQGSFTKVPESVVNLATAKKLKQILISRGYKVVMVRESQDVNISNIQRAQIANKSSSDLCIRIHCDGSGVSSVHGYFILTPSHKNKYLSSSIVDQSLKLTKCLLPAIQKTTGANNRGISYRDDLTGTNWSKIPTVLVEMGEMSNKQEDEALVTSAYQEKMAQGMANGIDDYFKS